MHSTANLTLKSWVGSYGLTKLDYSMMQIVDVNLYFSWRVVGKVKRLGANRAP